MAGIGCPAHIFNNAVRKGIEQFDYPIIQFANTVKSHFSNSVNRSECFIEFCNELNVNLYLNYYIEKFSYRSKFFRNSPQLVGFLSDDYVKNLPAVGRLWNHIFVHWTNVQNFFDMFLTTNRLFKLWNIKQYFNFFRSYLAFLIVLIPLFR